MKLTIFSLVVNATCLIFCIGLLVKTAGQKPPLKKQVVETIHRIPFCETCGQRMQCPECEAADFKPRIKLILPPPESVVPEVAEPPQTRRPMLPTPLGRSFAKEGWL